MLTETAFPTLANYPVDEPRQVLGLISGTSADGVDVARVRFPQVSSTKPPTVEAFDTVEYPASLREKVMEAAADRLTLRQTAVLHTELGEFFAQVAVEAASGHPVRLVGSHGQTVCHLPEARTTLQLADGSIIANRTGVVTVSDFRTADMALDGQGAPLVPLFDAYLLSRDDTPRVAVNLGGIANLTWLNGKPEETRAWDTGPANCLSDALCRLHGKGSYDPNGAMAEAGTVSETHLRRMLEHPYFSRAAPKTTGLEDFGEAFAREYFEGLSFEDKLRTALALSAQSLVNEIYRNPAPLQGETIELVFAGGGTSNRTLMAEIKERARRVGAESGSLEVKIRSFSEFGIPESAREAAAFAFLADRTARGLVGTLPSTTGARVAAVLGKISFPSRTIG